MLRLVNVMRSIKSSASIPYTCTITPHQTRSQLFNDCINDDVLCFKFLQICDAKQTAQKCCFVAYFPIALSHLFFRQGLNCILSSLVIITGYMSSKNIFTFCFHIFDIFCTSFSSHVT